MRWLLWRDPGSCSVCGADLERGAPWCGGCGARTDDTTRGGEGQPDAVRETQPETQDVEPRHDSATAGAAGPTAGTVGPTAQRAVVAVVLVALVGLGAAAQVRSAPAELLLGQLEGSTGVSATAPPPSGLRLAWAHEPPEGDSFTGSGAPQTVVAGDGRVRVGSRVVDLGTGRVVRAAPAFFSQASRDRVVADGDELVVIDTLTGGVRSRAPLPEGLDVRRTWFAQRSGGMSLFGSDQGSVLVADDGSVPARPDGVMFDHVDRALDGPAAFPLRRWRPTSADELTVPLELVAAASGEVVAEWPGANTRVADVSGDLAMVAETDGEVDLFSPAAISDVPWTVQLLDARTGQPWQQFEVGAREPPRLIGRFADGTAVVAVRSRDEGGITLLAVTPGGGPSPIARVEPGQGDLDSGLYVRSTSLHAAVLTGGVLVVRDDEGRIVGLDRDGAAVWRADTSGVRGLRAGDGYVALLHDDRGGRIQVMRAEDGAVVARLPPRQESGFVAEVFGTPVAAVNGHVGLGRERRFAVTEQRLGGVSWVDLRTGERTIVQDVFAPVLGNMEDRVGLDWSLHGTVTGEAGDAEPVLTRMRTRRGSRVVEVLEPREDFTAFDLPVPAADGRPGDGVRITAATPDLLVAWSEHFDGSPSVATHIFDRRAGTSMTVQDLLGRALVGDLLLAQEIDDRGTVTSLVGLDATTGQRRWSVDTTEPFPGTEVLRVDDGLIVDPGLTRLSALSPHDGTVVWSHASDVELSGEVVLGVRNVLAATTDGGVLALDREDGTIAWRTAVGAPIAAMTGAGDHVLVGTHDGLVVHLDGHGEEVQRIAVGTGPVHAVAALGDTVVATVDERVVGLRADGTGITREDEVELP